MRLIVKSFGTHVVDTNECKNISDLKIFLAQNEKLPLGSMDILYGDSILENDQDLSSLPEEATVDVSVPILGGKMHGSLARAGKVRNQTPKVAKMEKKKRPKGRAKRRWQYNRRFVAVTASAPGARKRGPNSNMKA
ncbi:hypothetical protein Ciccas_001924 [Cichlidogyrus casuarinus]|uniref:Ubiquitin-like domain-containing protein n=1 Tax=Cichlidogyrus casuarinus TaxID=1844966 RepID=A0ABD2QIP4_9PLAT